MDRTELMTKEAIAEAIARLAPDAVGVIEQTLRSKGRSDRTRVDAAWRVLREARKVAPEVGGEDVKELGNVLELVSGD